MERPHVTAHAAAPRSNGLDTLRALAISLVFVYHYKVFVSRAPDFGWLSSVGWLGVDLFFVLSGYLIANQLFAGIAAGRGVAVRTFYLRRALRTLPVFWLVLAAYAAFPSVFGGKPPPPWWRFLTFTQNLGLQPGTAFSHAWSLCVEEQFYLVLPALLVLGARLGAGRVAGWLTIVGLIAFGMAVRAQLWARYGLESSGRIDGYYPAVYYATLCRFDEFLPGVALALLKNFHRPVWARITRHGHAVFAVGALATAVMLVCTFHFYYIDDFGYGFFMSTFGYSLNAMAFALLVAAALSPGSWLARIRIPGATKLALCSYSVYLSHRGVATVVQAQLKPFGLAPEIGFVLTALACVAVGWLLYRAVEAPFLALRERFMPSAAAPPPARAAALS